MLGKRKGKQRREYVRDYVLYDLETTGISSLYDEVIEISAVKVRMHAPLKKSYRNFLHLPGMMCWQGIISQVLI